MRFQRPAITTLLVLALGLAACGGGDPDEPDAAAAEGSTESQSDDEGSNNGSESDESDTPVVEDFDPNAVLRYAVPGVAQSLDPRTANEFQQALLEQVYEPLVRTTPEGEFIPGLALEWGLVDDGNAFELVLREDVTFQDGEPFNAEAVVANLELGLEEGSNFTGDLEVVESVEVVDDYTVWLRLNGPGGHLAGVLAGYPGLMISPAALDRDLRLEPVGAGPFTLDSVTETLVTFERWDDYYAADEVTVAGLEFHTFDDESARLRALESGQLDGAFLSPSQVAQAEASGINVDTAMQTTFHGILVNTAHEALGVDEVRQALSLAIDRDAVSQALYDGRCVPSVQPYPSTYWAYADEVESGDRDIEAARSLLADAGFPDGFDVTISAGSITTYRNLAEVLQQQFADIGITVEVNITTTLSDERRSGDFDLIVGAAQSGRPDPSVFFVDHYATDGARNFGGVSFGELESLIDESRQTADTAERAEVLGEMIELTVEQGMTHIPICLPETITAFRDGVTGFTNSVLGYRDFRHMKVAPAN